MSERYDLQGGRLAYGDVAKEVLRERDDRLGKLASQVTDAWPHARRELETLRDNVSVALGKGSRSKQKEKQKAKKAKKAAQKLGKATAPAPAPAPAPGAGARADAAGIDAVPDAVDAAKAEDDGEDDGDPEMLAEQNNTGEAAADVDEAYDAELQAVLRLSMETAAMEGDARTKTARLEAEAAETAASAAAAAASAAAAAAQARDRAWWGAPAAVAVGVGGVGAVGHVGADRRVGAGGGGAARARRDAGAAAEEHDQRHGVRLLHDERAASQGRTVPPQRGVRGVRFADCDDVPGVPGPR